MHYWVLPNTLWCFGQYPCALFQYVKDTTKTRTKQARRKRKDRLWSEAATVSSGALYIDRHGLKIAFLYIIWKTVVAWLTTTVNFLRRDIL